MQRRLRPPFFTENKSKREGRKSIPTTSVPVYAIFVLLIALVSIIFVFEEPKESWPEIITYVTTNPLLAAVVVSVIVFLAVDRFRELSERVGSISQRLFDQKSSTDKEIENAVEKLEAKLTAKWERVGNQIDQIEQENPWLISLAENDLLVNIPTATAALKNVEILISANEFGVAYEVLYNAAKQGSDDDTRLIGTTYDFEALATISFVLFEDAATADMLMRRAQDIAIGRHRYWLARRIQFALFSGRLSAAFDLAKELYDDMVPTYWEALLRRFGQSNSTIYPQDRALVLSSLFPFLDDLITSRKVNGGRRWFDMEYSVTSPETQAQALILKDLWEGRPVHEAEPLNLESETDLTSSRIMCHVASRRMRNSIDPCTTEISLLGMRLGLRLFGDLQAKPKAKAPELDGALRSSEDAESASTQNSSPDSQLGELFPSANRRTRRKGPISPGRLLGGLLPNEDGDTEPKRINEPGQHEKPDDAEGDNNVENDAKKKNNRKQKNSRKQKPTDRKG